MYVGFMVPETTKHITLTFNGREETVEEYKRAVAAVAEVATDWYSGYVLANLTGELEAFGRDKDTWVTLVAAKRMHPLRDLLIDALTRWDVPWSEEFEFRPHVTMNGNKKPKQGLTGEYRLTRLAIMSDFYGKTEVLI